MENTTPANVCSTNHIDILTDALAKCKERFDKAVQDGDTSRLYDCVSQMTQLSHSITEAVKAERESRAEKAVAECADAVDALADEVYDLYMLLTGADDDATDDAPLQ